MARKGNNRVFIGTSLDGYIADQNGGLEYLDIVPNPDQSDLGYYDFMAGIDALVMGRTSFETVLSFDIDWPYQKPVFVLSHTLEVVPPQLVGKVHLLSGSLDEVIQNIHERGYYHLYIDGGKVVQSFLRKDLIDEMIVTQVPVLLGGGVPLFADLPAMLEFELVDSRVLLGHLSQRHYRRKRSDPST